MKKNYVLSLVLIICLLVGAIALVACDNSNYTITIDTMEHGSVTADKTTAKEGDTVKLTVTPEMGYRLVAGSLKMNGNTIEGNEFKMPAKDVKITAEFTYGKELPKLTLDNAYNVLKNNSGTMDMRMGDSMSTYQMRTDNAIYLRGREGDLESVMEYFKVNNKWYEAVKPYDSVVYIGTSDNYDFNDYYMMALDLALVENAGKYFVQDGDAYVVAPEYYAEYTKILSVDYDIKTLKITIPTDNKSIKLEFIFDGLEHNILYTNIGSTIVNISEDAYNAPIEAKIEYYCIFEKNNLSNFIINTFENTELLIDDFTTELNKTFLGEKYNIKGIYSDEKLTQLITMPYIVKLPEDPYENIKFYFELELKN